MKLHTVEVGETLNSPAKVMSVLQNVPIASEVGMSGEVEKDHEMTRAEKDCVMTSSEEEMDDLNAFVDGKLQLMTEKGLEQVVGDESVNVEEILSGNLAVFNGHIMGSEEFVDSEVDEGRTTSVCPGLAFSANVDWSSGEVSFHESGEVDRIFREQLSRSRVTSTPLEGLWPIYSERRSSVLGGAWGTS